MALLLMATLLLSCESMPKRTCSGVYSLDDIGWYKKQMRAAGASPLCSTQNSNKEAYRFTWLRSFDNPIAVTLRKNGDKVYLNAVRLNGHGGYEPGTIVERRSVHLTLEEFNEFHALIVAMHFWDLKSYDELLTEAASNDELIIGMDGARWIIEGAKSEIAHAADRWSPDEGLFHDAAIFLLNKSRIDRNGPTY